MSKTSREQPDDNVERVTDALLLRIDGANELPEDQAEACDPDWNSQPAGDGGKGTLANHGTPPRAPGAMSE
jgi:hypothetical protein